MYNKYMEKQNNEFTESSFKFLNHIDHIRSRLELYIGDIGDGSKETDGIYFLLKFIIDRSIYDFQNGYCNKIEITRDNNKFSIRDNSKGIDFNDVVSIVRDVYLNNDFTNRPFTRFKNIYDDNINFIVLNALSSKFTIKSIQDEKYASAYFSKGKLIREEKGIEKDHDNGLLIEFVADDTIFIPLHIEDKIINTILSNCVYLNPGLEITYNNKIFLSKNGLFDLIKNHSNNQEEYPIIHYKDNNLEIAFTHSKDNNKAKYFSYVNGFFTSEGGAHQNAILKGITKAIKETEISEIDVSKLQHGLIGAISINIDNPIFYNQKNVKLVNFEIEDYYIESVKNIVKEAIKDKTHFASSIQKRIT